MKCNNCGAEISDEARFCEKCGAPVGQPDEKGPAADAAANEEIPAPKPLEQPLSVGAVPFVPMAPAPRGMPRSMRAPRPYEPRPGFSPAQPGTQKPKRATSFAELAEQVPPAPDPEESREQRADEAMLKTDQGSWQSFPAASAVSELPDTEGEAREEKRREREEAERRRREVREQRAKAKREERERREAERVAAERERREAVEAAAAETAATSVDAEADVFEPLSDADSTAQLNVPAAAPRKAGASPRVIAAIAAVVVIAIIGVVAVGAMNRPAQEPAAPSGQSQEGGASGAGAPSGANTTDAGNDADEVAKRASVEDYSWDELSELSAQIAAADSDEAGLAIAEEHNLCTASGKLDGTQAKKLELSDGTKVTMHIVGFRQDQKADGSGVAGITMLSEDAVATRYVSTAGSYSGWEGSELRSWMNDNLMSELPDEVASKVVEVSKKTNGQGTKSVTSVSDKLWVPSFSEVVGKLSAGMKRSDVYEPEGDQYQLFSDEDVRWGGTFAILTTKGSDGYWWLRSVDPLNTQYYLCVSKSGEPWYSHLPATEHAILMGFCL